MKWFAKVAAGVLAGVVVSAAWNVGLQYVVWGDRAPDWYVVPIVIVGLVCGYAGAALGFRWADAT